MVRELNINKKEELINQLKKHYPELTNEEFNKINESFDQFVTTISLKTLSTKENVTKVLNDSIDFINSKHLI